MSVRIKRERECLLQISENIIAVSQRLKEYASGSLELVSGPISFLDAIVDINNAYIKENITPKLIDLFINLQQMKNDSEGDEAIESYSLCKVALICLIEALCEIGFTKNFVINYIRESIDAKNYKNITNIIIEIEKIKKFKPETTKEKEEYDFIKEKLS